MADPKKPTPTSPVVKKTIHVHFTTEQKAALGDQMADVQSQLEGVKAEKKEVVAKYTARLNVLGARMKEYADAVRAGEGDIEIECMWKPDANKPMEHLWRLDTWEVIESRPMDEKQAKKRADADRQQSLLATSPAPGGDGKATPAGGSPGEKPPRAPSNVLRLAVGPMPPCPAPVAENPGGICGLDGDREYHDGFCAKHGTELAEADRRAILDGIAETRRQMRVQQAAERRVKEQQSAIATSEDVTRAELHTKADKAKGPELDALGAPLACARTTGEEDAAYLVRLKVAIDAAHKAATARAAAKGEKAAAPAPTGEGAVPPIVREKPREVTGDLIAQLAEASRQAGPAAAAAGGEPEAATTAPTVNDPPAPVNAGPDPVNTGEEPTPGNEALPPAPADEVIDEVAQPLYNARRPDGWPLCPQCGTDNLWSPGVPATEASIVHCEACGWRPPVDAIPTRPALALAPPAPPIAFVPGKQRLQIGDVEIDTSGLLDHGRLLVNGPCEHSQDVGPCVECTRAAVAAARAAISSGPTAEEQQDAAASARAQQPVECPPLRRQLTVAERASRKAACECGKVVNIRPVIEDGAHVATLPKHKRQEAQS
jgi:hypothetical protein